MGKHTCHWPGCGQVVPPRLWGCKAHWYRLPKKLRDEIWRTYRPGQEMTKTPGREYIQAARTVQDWIAQQPPQPAGADMPRLNKPELVARRVRQLTDIQQRVVELHKAGRSPAEISTEMCLTESTIRSKLAALRRGLAKGAYADLADLRVSQPEQLELFEVAHA